MNTKILFAAVAIVAAFGIGAVIGSPTVTTPALAQNITDGNMTMMGDNMTGGICQLVT